MYFLDFIYYWIVVKKNWKSNIQIKSMKLTKYVKL
jgi:hypothetical protein